MDFDSEDVHLQNSLTSPFLASHHTAPLTYYPQRLVVRYFSGAETNINTPIVVRGINMCLSLRQKHNNSLFVSEKPAEFYYYCLNVANSNSAYDTNEILIHKLRNSIFTSLKLIRSEISGLVNAHPYLKSNLSFDGIPDCEVEKIILSVLSSYSLYEFLKSIRCHIQQKSTVKNTTLETKRWCDLEITFNCYELVAIHLLGSDKLILINYDQFLMVLDAVLSRFLVKLTTLLSDIIGRETLPSWQMVTKVYSWGDNLIRDFGMKAYKLIGMFEDLVTTTFVNFEDSDPLGLGEPHTKAILTDLNEIDQKDLIPIGRTLDLLNYLREIKCPNQLSELFGLRKHWGNPMVDARKSGRAVQEKLNEDLPVTSEGLTTLLASFNRMIVVEFIKKNGEWPKGVFLNGAESFPICQAFNANNCRLPEQSLDHRHNHWAHFKFLPNCVISSFEDSLSLLSDKSVSLPRSKLDNIYERTRQKNPPDRNCMEQRRLILEFLREDKLSILEIFKVVMSGDIPIEWLANSSSMKGTEMKHEKARIFAVLTYELRQYFAATEELIKQHIFPYNPHQTMTMNEIELTNRLRDITSQMDPESESRYLYVIHIIDFAKWNLRMKYSNTAGVFKSIDDFLGTPGLIEATHDIFMSMINLVQDKYNPPEDGVEFTESDTIWTLHNRGWEGQRQKGWTALTSANLSAVELETGVHSEIIGQGDNQVLLSRFRVPENYRNPWEWIAHKPGEVKNLLDIFFSKLEKRCDAVGLKIKSGESCRSLSYFNYGKRLYFNGIELSMTLKRLSKAMTEPNDSYPTSENIFKTMTGTELASNLYSHPSVVPVVVSNIFNCLQIYSSFMENPLVADFGFRELSKRGLRMNSSTLYSLLSIPPSLGGIPSLSLIAESYRGHPDPLSEDIVSLSLRANSNDLVSRKILQISLSGKWFKVPSSLDRRVLISAPYSLNLKMPTSATSPLVNSVLPAVQSFCKNSRVKPLFDPGLLADEMSIYKWLATSSPFCPLILNDVFERTIPGRRRSFLSGLSNSTSLSRLTLNKSDRSIYSEVLSGERNQILWWVMMLEDLSWFNVSDNETEFKHHVVAQTLRDLSWGLPVIGVTVPHPAQQLMLTGTRYGSCDGSCDSSCPEHIIFVYMSEDLIGVKNYVSEKPQLNRMRGFKPYTGNKISEGIIQKQIINLNYSNCFQDTVRLNTIRKWISKDGDNMSDALLNLIATRTNVEQSIIDKATGMPSRLSHNHRAALMATKKTCATASTTNISSRIYISSNLMGKYSHGEENYSLPYGPSFLFGQQMIALTKVYGINRASEMRDIIHFHVRSDDVPVVYDGGLNTSEALVLSTFRVSGGHPLFVQFSQLQLRDLSGNVAGDVWINKQSMSLSQMRMAYASQLIGNSLVEETMMREQISFAVRSTFVRRSANISVGDIKIVKVRNLVSVLAMQILILLPYSIHILCEIETFYPALAEYLDKFSDSFWSQFTVSLINPRLIDQLISLSPNSLRANSTRNNKYLNSVLRDVVLFRIWQLKIGALQSMQQRSVSPVIIFAPTMEALKYLYTKWVEAHLLMLFSQGVIRKLDLFGFARDFSYNIQSSPNVDLKLIMTIINKDFGELSQKLLGFKPLELQYPICVSMSESWIDSLRAVQMSREESNTEDYPTVEESVQGVNPSYYSDIHINDYSWSLNFNLPSSPAEVSYQRCDCTESASNVEIRTEIFFQPSGSLSKSHYKFLDRIFALDLPVESVMCLGTSTGTEAAAISLLPNCVRIYTNCLNDLKFFSQHAAATCIPTAFHINGIREKLIRTVESNLVLGDLTDLETVEEIAHHTHEYTWSGITCDAELPRSTPFCKKYKLLENIIKIGIIRLHEDGWIVIKISPKCTHEFQCLISLLGGYFQTVNATFSCYSGRRQNLYFLTGRGVKSRIYTMSISYRILLPILECDDVNTLYLFPQLLVQPAFTLLNREEREARLRLSNILKALPKVSLDVYLRGLYVDFDWKKVNLSRCLRSLALYRASLESIVNDILYSSARLYEGEVLPRSGVLITSEFPLYSQLNNLYQKVYRSELLERLISKENFNFDELESEIQSWLYSQRSYKIKNYDFVVHVNVTRFYQFFSRHLMEILGVFFSHEFDAYSTNTTFYGCHLINEYNIRITNENPLDPIPPTRLKPYKNNSWRWRRRSEFLFCFQASYILKRDKISVKLTYPYLLQEISELTGVKIELSTEPPLDAFVAIHLPVDIIVESIIRNPTLIFIDLEVLQKLISKVVVNNLYRPIWSGRIPSFVIASVSPRQSNIRFTQPYTSGLYPNYHMLSQNSYSFGKTLINCACVDCASEEILLKYFNLSHQDIDRICSVGKISSIRERHQKI